MIYAIYFPDFLKGVPYTLCSSVILSLSLFLTTTALFITKDFLITHQLACFSDKRVFVATLYCILYNTLFTLSPLLSVLLGLKRIKKSLVFFLSFFFLLKRKKKKDETR